MEAKANIQVGHVNNEAKQKVSLTYYVGPFDTVEESQSCKYALDQIAKQYGAEVHNDAKIIGEELDQAATADAVIKKKKADELIAE